MEKIIAAAAIVIVVVGLIVGSIVLIEKEAIDTVSQLDKNNSGSMLYIPYKPTIDELHRIDWSKSTIYQNQNKDE